MTALHRTRHLPVSPCRTIGRGWVLPLLALLWLGGWPLLGVTPATADPLTSCQFTMTEVAFGPVDVLPGTAIASSGIVTVRCPALVTLPGVTLSACIAFPTPRQMQGPSTTLAYDFYGPTPLVTSWSATTPITLSLSQLLNGGSIAVTVPAKILAGQSTAGPGSYAVPVTAGVTYGLLGCATGLVYHTTLTTMVDATVLSACTIAGGAIAFGSNGLLSGALAAQGQLSLQCSLGTSYTIGLDGGHAMATDPTRRQMLPASGPGAVVYGLYRDAARTLPWGSAAGAVLAGTGTAATQMAPVYARVPPQPTPPPGSYSDTVVVTVTY